MIYIPLGARSRFQEDYQLYVLEWVWLQTASQTEIVEEKRCAVPHLSVEEAAVLPKEQEPGRGNKFILHWTSLLNTHITASNLLFTKSWMLYNMRKLHHKNREFLINILHRVWVGGWSLFLLLLAGALQCQPVSQYPALEWGLGDCVTVTETVLVRRGAAPVHVAGQAVYKVNRGT